jgi:hypothetical protein
MKKLAAILGVLGVVGLLFVLPALLAGDRSKPIEFEREGFSVSRPHRWTTNDLSPRDKQAGMVTDWVLVENQNLEGSIGIVMKDAAGLKLDDIATHFAESYKGRVLPDEVTIDGERARKVELPAATGQIHPVLAYFAMHRGAVFSLVLSTSQGEGPRDDFEAVRASVKWRTAR